MKTTLTEKQIALIDKKRALMDELTEFENELYNSANKHRVSLAWRRIEAIKISDENGQQELKEYGCKE